MATSFTKPALILIDVINAFDFEGCETLVAAAIDAAPAIQTLASKARTQGVPVIYANDNFGQWRSDFKTTLDACSMPDKPGHDVVAQLRPHEGDYFVLKPKHSAFYGTPLDIVLRELGVDSLVLAGFATDLCILFTAHDAHMRGFSLFVPEDCTAANSPEVKERALAHLRDAIGCETGVSNSFDFMPSSD